MTLPQAIVQSTKLVTPENAPSVAFDLEKAVAKAKIIYASRRPASKSFHEKAIQTMPGGNTRSVLYNNPFPVCMKKGEGNRLWDHDGIELVTLYIWV
jgi:glutamate-1-semialdehyde 2,1-aminomutase